MLMLKTVIQTILQIRKDINTRMWFQSRVSRTQSWSSVTTRGQGESSNSVGGTTDSRPALLNSVQVKIKVKRKTESKSRSESVRGRTNLRPASRNSVQVKIKVKRKADSRLAALNSVQSKIKVKRKTKAESKSKIKCWRDDGFETCFIKFSPGKNKSKKEKESKRKSKSAEAISKPGSKKHSQNKQNKKKRWIKKK